MGLLINDRAMASRGDLSQKIPSLKTISSQILLCIIKRLRDFLKSVEFGLKLPANWKDFYLNRLVVRNALLAVCSKYRGGEHRAEGARFDLNGTSSMTIHWCGLASAKIWCRRNSGFRSKRRAVEV
jgi:hypothetical protein